MTLLRLRRTSRSLSLSVSVCSSTSVTANPSSCVPPSVPSPSGWTICICRHVPGHHPHPLADQPEHVPSRYPCGFRVFSHQDCDPHRVDGGAPGPEDAGPGVALWLLARPVLVQAPSHRGSQQGRRRQQGPGGARGQARREAVRLYRGRRGLWRRGSRGSRQGPRGRQRSVTSIMASRPRRRPDVGHFAC